MKTPRLIYLILLIVQFPFLSRASLVNINEIIVKTDTAQYKYSTDCIRVQGENYLPVFFQNESEIWELNIFPKQAKAEFRVLPSSEFEIIDSLVLISQNYYRLKIKINNLNRSHFINLTFQTKTSDSNNYYTEEIKIFPYTRTTVSFLPSNDELYIGEEKTFELSSNNFSNIKISGEWQQDNDVNYKISDNNGQLRIHFIPNSLGVKTVKIRIPTKIPFLDENKKMIYECLPVIQTFRVKASRMAFLKIDKNDITYNDESRNKGIEITIDNGKNIVINKTYRIENQEQPGGPLIAEIFTKNYLANDKVLGILRAYNLHRQSDGYLYIKDGDETKFIANFSITPKTSVSNLAIMRNGQDWNTSNTVYPGEIVDVKIEGEGFHKANFYWEDVTNLLNDSISQNENTHFFKLQIPLNINKRKISLYNWSSNTGISLNVKEYQNPRPFDYISLNTGNGKRTLYNMSPTLIMRKTVPDIVFSFDNLKIDSENKIYGRQYLDIDIRFIGKKGELIELKELKNILICPADNSPRAPFYKDKNCTNENISLNALMGNKTYNMEDFSKIQLEIKNSADKYTESVNSKKIDIIIQRPVVFDIDVSFPAGLLVQNLGRTKTEQEDLNKYNDDYNLYKAERDAYLKELELWTANPTGSKPTFGLTEPVKPSKAAFTDNIGGISLALIAQFSFPDAQKIGKIKPYRFGAGFLAINAFNFSESAKRDLAVVALASLYTIRPGKIFNLPIHFGFGYKFQDKIPFIMLSPGIGIRF